jgi:hypothetical protein
MAKGILILILSLALQGSVEEHRMSSKSLGRQDMPDQFPYQLLSEGFAVLEITLQNHSKEEWLLKVDDIEVFSKKGKRIKPALPTDITPKILKYYMGMVGYDGHPEERTIREEIYQERTVGVRTGQPMISVDTVEGLKSTLERYRLKDSRIAPGETVEAFYYLKSKDSGNRLKGGWLVLDGKRIDF